MTVFISRRELLKRAGLAGAAAVVAPVLAPGDPAAAPQTAAKAAPAIREPLETLTAAEADALEAIVARLIPSDASGPGAAEARAAHYIDRALGGALAPMRDAYASGLAALDRYARSSRGGAFAQLPASDQDAVLTAVESGAASGFSDGAAAFFAMVRTHTLQGTFGDPFYGGNAAFVGWDLVGYPGVRTIVTATDQRLGAGPTRNHKSAYDYPMFSKASARAATDHDPQHGD
jgi:gluconate 2-dehydrogenase gamma chain